MGVADHSDPLKVLPCVRKTLLAFSALVCNYLPTPCTRKAAPGPVSGGRAKMQVLDLDALTLSSGSHESPSEGHCLLEVVSMFAGEPFSDRPRCVCPVLAAFARS